MMRNQKELSLEAGIFILQIRRKMCVIGRRRRARYIENRFKVFWERMDDAYINELDLIIKD